MICSFSISLIFISFLFFGGGRVVSRCLFEFFIFLLVRFPTIFLHLSSISRLIKACRALHSSPLFSSFLSLFVFLVSLKPKPAHPSFANLLYRIILS